MNSDLRPQIVSSFSRFPLTLHPFEAKKHPGVTCDGCKQLIGDGIRFKCLDCPDFDFCDRCEVGFFLLPLLLSISYLTVLCC